MTSALSQAIGLVIARNALPRCDALWGTLLRIGPALAVLAAVTAAKAGPGAWRFSLTSRSQVIALVAASFCGTFLGVLLQSIGTKFAKAGIVSALTSTFPLWVIPIARLFLKEHTNRRCVWCTLLAVAGICLMVVPAPYLRGAWAEILSFFQAVAGPV